MTLNTPVKPPVALPGSCWCRAAVTSSTLPSRTWSCDASGSLVKAAATIGTSRWPASNSPWPSPRAAMRRILTWCVPIRPATVASGANTAGRRPYEPGPTGATTPITATSPVFASPVLSAIEIRKWSPTLAPIATASDWPMKTRPAWSVSPEVCAPSRRRNLPKAAWVAGSKPIRRTNALLDPRSRSATELTTSTPAWMPTAEWRSCGSFASVCPIVGSK